MKPSDLIKATIVSVAGFAAAPVMANDSMPVPPDASDVDKAAYAVLDKYCSACHQEGALGEGLTSPKSGFGHVTDLSRLAQDPKFVTQGDPAKSRLYQVITGGAPPMPDQCWSPDCTPTADELAVLSAWIESLDDHVIEKPYISLEDLHQMAHTDLQAQPTNRRGKIRYLSMRTMWNDADVSPENYEGYKAATVKLLNALSWNPSPYKFEKVDEHGVLLRIYLPELDWDQDKWHLLEAKYPYGLDSGTDSYLGPLQHLSETRIPIIRADWFAATASVSPLYYDMLSLPDTVQELEKLLNLDLLGNIENELVVRAGFQNSGVSDHNRLIERHPLSTGFFWTSYDFAGSVGRQSFFKFPLGPVEAYGDTHAFKHDGGESIFTLPNGFHAYYLNTAAGQRLNVGPTAIVRDTDYPDGTGEVVNGISCISCHSKGIRLNNDEVRDVALGDFSLPAEAHQTIDAIYPGKEVVNEWFEKDMQAFFASLENAGIDPTIKAGGWEPVRGLFVYHIDHFIDFQQAANELGLTEDEFRSRAAFVGSDLASLVARMDQAPLARDAWATAYPAILSKVTKYKSISTEHVAATHLPASVKKVVDASDYPVPDKKPADHVDAHADDLPPAKKPTPIYGHDDAAKGVGQDYDPVAHSVTAQSHLTVYTDKPTYKVGEGLKIIIEPRHDCQLTLISIDDQHRSCVLFPFPGLEDITIKGGEQYTFPPRGSLKTTVAGLETILAICNANKEAISKVRSDTSAVSCSAADYQHLSPESYTTVVNEVLALDLGDDTVVADDKKQSGAGVDYRAISDHNPDVIKSQISVVVTEY